MKAIGLTGGMGMGKSACAQLLRERAVPVVDTDELARQVVAPGQSALAEIESAFGPGMVEPGGSLRRNELARRVFAEPAARRRLEAILHPRIRQLWQAQLAAWAAEGRRLAVVVIPLLFETDAQKEFAKVLCVACSAATQRARLQGRNWPAEQTEQRLQAQWPIEDKLARADFVIWTEGGLDLHAEQLTRILKSLGAS